MFAKMTNTWLCLLAKHIPYFQSRLLSSSTSYLQGRGNIIPADVACLSSLPDDTNLILQSEPPSDVGLDLKNGETLEGKVLSHGQSPKSDIFSLLCWPLGSRNKELINSLRKIVQPVKCAEVIHVKKSTNRAECCHVDGIYYGNFVNISHFNCLDDPFNKDLQLKQNHGAPLSHKTDNIQKYSNLSNTSDNKDDDDDKRKGPTIAQLEKVKEYYIKISPSIMRKGERWKLGMLDNDIIFENNLRKKPKTTVGLGKYLHETGKIRIYAACRYPVCSLQVRNINIHPQNGYVKIHWTASVSTTSQILCQVTSFFLKFLERESYSEKIEFISTIYVNRHGKVAKHVVDRRIRIEDENVSTVKNLAAKTAGMVGLSPKANYKGQKEGTTS